MERMSVMQDKKTIAKKTVILCVLNVIRKYATKENPVTQTALCQFLRDLGIACDRKTVGRNIEYLCRFGYPIIKREGRGYYLDEEKLAACRNPLVV